MKKIGRIRFILLLAMELSAQSPQGARSVGLVFPVGDYPLRLRQTEEWVRRLPDGSVERSKLNKIVYRDAEGRVRTQVEGDDSGQGSVQLTEIVDPTEGAVIALDPVHKIAVRMRAPKSKVGQFALSLPGVIEEFPDTKWDDEVTQLQKRTIEGIEFDGLRIMNVSRGNQPVRIVYERWTSKAVGLVGFATAVGPTSEHTARIEHIDRVVPDASLFVVPAGYTIKDVSMLPSQ